MAEPTTKRIKIWQALLIIVSIIIAAPIALISFSFALSPLQDVLNRDRFNNLDIDMRDLYSTISKASDGKEDWKYDKNCKIDTVYYFGFGASYLCSTNIYMIKIISGPEEIKQLHERYYSLFQSSDHIIPQNGIQIFTPDIFGILFQVSVADQDYNYKKDPSINCKYTAALNQLNPNYDNYRYGRDIENNTGKASISLKCTDKASSDWY